MPLAVIALGTNVGDRLGHMQRAVDALAHVMVLRGASRVYETAPMYLEDQPPFLNAAILAQTDLGPLPLLRRLKMIEQELGRKSREQNGPREIDLDLVLFGNLSYRFSEGGKAVLSIPHPKMGERRFVLAPLADLLPDCQIPNLGPIAKYLEATNGQAETVLPLEHAVLSL
jgi:2-amino-4-hydroxy-6-hydroxymethyldihydropteridine diphosphokinase